jgi:hypothetical protein
MPLSSLLKTCAIRLVTERINSYLITLFPRFYKILGSAVETSDVYIYASTSKYFLFLLTTSVFLNFFLQRVSHCYRDRLIEAENLSLSSQF